MKPILIAIAGGTASGKTTVVDEIINHFQSEDVAVICQDNYYSINPKQPLHKPLISPRFFQACFPAPGLSFANKIKQTADTAISIG